MKSTNHLSRLKVLEVGEMAGGPEHLLAKYLASKAADFIHIEILRTLYWRPNMNFLRVSYYRGGKLERSLTHGAKLSFFLCWSKARRMLLYFLVSLFILTFPLRLKRRFDIFIGMGPPHPLAGLILRKFGLVRKVISVSFDHLGYSPNFFIRIYRLVDKLAQNSSDAVFYHSSRLIEVKKEERFIKNNDIPRIVTPIGVDLEEARNIPQHEIERTSIGYIGKLDEEVGLEVTVEVISIVAKVVPNVKLKIIGSGPTEAKLKEEVRLLNLQDNVEFLGYVDEREMARDILSKCAICIAPYVPETAYSIQYTDSAKVKEYMEYGTPIIVTKVPEIAREIEEKRAGFAVNYNKEEIANAMRKLLTDNKLWQECRENVARLALKYDYKKIYAEAFQASGMELAGDCKKYHIKMKILFYKVSKHVLKVKQCIFYK